MHQPYRLKKQNNFNNSGNSPEDAFDAVRPLMHLAGVTRVANITGLDRLGIPVYNAIRPNLKDFSVHHGKGLTPAASKISALMEAFERCCAAAFRPPSSMLSYRELASCHKTIPFERIALSKSSLFNEHLPVPWIFGWDIVHQEEVAVPLAQVVLLDVTKPFSVDFSHGALNGFFQRGSNGLAADTTLLGAIFHALLEVIERDAITCSALQAQTAGSPYPLRRVRLDTIPYPVVRDLLGKIREADVLPLLFDCTVDTGVPTFNCYLMDLKYPHAMEVHGMGSSLDPGVAMVRAVTEAAQARAVFKSGCRDTSFREDYVTASLENKTARMDRLSKTDGEVDASSFHDRSTGSLEGDIWVCVERLKAVGIDQVVVLDIGPGHVNLSVVKVIVPGLEGYLNGWFTPGERGRRALGGDVS